MQNAVTHESCQYEVCVRLQRIENVVDIMRVHPQSIKIAFACCQPDGARNKTRSRFSYFSSLVPFPLMSSFSLSIRFSCSRPSSFTRPFTGVNKVHERYMKLQWSASFNLAMEDSDLSPNFAAAWCTSRKRLDSTHAPTKTHKFVVNPSQCTSLLILRHLRACSGCFSLVIPSWMDSDDWLNSLVGCDNFG